MRLVKKAGKTYLRMTKSECVKLGTMMKKSNNYIEQTIEVEMPETGRWFNVTFEYYAESTPARIRSPAEYSSPPEYDADYRITQIIETAENGAETDVTQTLDENARATIEGKVDEWVSENGSESWADDAADQADRDAESRGDHLRDMGQDRW